MEYIIPIALGVTGVLLFREAERAYGKELYGVYMLYGLLFLASSIIYLIINITI